ncbi:MAG: beta-N-acetylhexosaminidase [Elusimicrobia bacterium]|nr:beta-N-acetylhexosaminidase [Elusimicrobiota bacterium]
MNLGSLFIFGVHGKRATKRTVDLLKKTRAGGVLLLARNIDTPEQTRALTRELVQRVGRPLLFCVDHEGGWVLRFKSGVTALPGNAALGRAGSADWAYAAGRQMALELKSLGIQLNLAPVMDVLTTRYNPGIGIRSFGSDPALVGRLGASMIRGLQDHGVGACAKHFPGKGAASVDAHVDLPAIRIPRSEFERVHLAPFKTAVEAGVDCVMTSHVRYPALDSAAATFSKKITAGVLRRRLGFNGLVISDDLCMGAVTRTKPVQLAAVEALAAGHDLLIIAHDSQAQEESADLLGQAAADGLVGAEVLERSCERLKKFLKLRGGGAAPASASKLAREGELLSAKIAARAVRIIQRGVISLPLGPDSEPTVVLFPDFKEVRERFTFEGGPRGPENMLRESLAGWGKTRLLRAPIESTDMRDLPQHVERASRVIFFCFEAMRFSGQKAVLQLLRRKAADKTAVCLIRNSWDLTLAGPRMTVLDSAGYRLCQLKAALKALTRKTS